MKLIKHDVLDHGRASTLRNALGTALERYAEIAKDFEGYAIEYAALDEAGKQAWKATNSWINPRALPDLKKQFERQVTEVQDLIDWLDGDKFQDENGQYPENTEFTVVAGLIRDF
ncbi:hypothetical protein HOU02_gp149 [Caulobacter phage CcrBL9]|uniref:Uncharacterized protein n=1 Tax=Caulobacter phage CcrBL9 TaxID=2283270 RepID=A0A385ED18_9CAUD|nr:hypothetical protein HOU02_gp036 [Caulobacter phage CcrBL9]YP_009810206.1 hypothetical protein HOU02_gp149 [Caulobacter phage CcrBL9]AXQ69060.1 hypothetical protein CcrBL9_gp036 [Caulobacter phage CcrBL9]AXQ69576.1 hypothetical protein CcrBL9_gp552 [Caulobacter phage CcrBL9]